MSPPTPPPPPRPPTSPPLPPGASANGQAHDFGRERLLDLLVARATEGLNAHEANEMAGLLERHPDVDPEMFDLAAASAALGMVGESDRDVRLPEGLRRRLMASYADGGTNRGPSEEPRAVVRRIGWAPMAVAACLGLAAGIVITTLLGPGGGGSSPVVASADAPGATVEAMERFAKIAPDAVRIPFKGAAPGFEAAVGEVVWSDREQAGYLRVANLAPNDRTVSQYQLWIVDPSRDAKPVDGGVFDVRPGESVVKIAAKLRVEKPAVFAITKEKVGGVVVSAGPLLVVAAR